jgi:hypothetical protein
LLREFRHPTSGFWPIRATREGAWGRGHDSLAKRHA